MQNKKIEILEPEKNIEVLEPIKKRNNKKKIFIILLVVILVIGGIIILKKNNKKEEEPLNNETQEQSIDSSTNEEKIDEIPPDYTEYLCEKEGNYGVLDNKISYRNKYQYSFSFENNEKIVDNGTYSINYVFNNITDYNNASKLPNTFRDTFYQEKDDEKNLTKTQMYYYVLEYSEINKANYLLSYLEMLEQDNFICELIEKENVINDYDVYYGRNTEN